jgi:hypothetical protein
VLTGIYNVHHYDHSCNPRAPDSIPSRVYAELCGINRQATKPCTLFSASSVQLQRRMDRKTWVNLKWLLIYQVTMVGSIFFISVQTG